MDLDLTEDQRMILDSVRRFATERLAPNAYAHDAEVGVPRAVYGELAELGLMGMYVPGDDGGAELDTITGCLVVEELSRQDASVGALVGLHNGVVLPHVRAAGDEAKAQWQDRLIGGEALGAVLPGCADGAYTNHFVLGGDADLFVGVGDSARLFEASAVEVTPIDNPLGLRGARPARVKVEAKGPTYAAQSRAAIDVHLSAVAVGIGRGALEQATSYALERKQFKRPISDFQAIQWMLADMATELDAARLLVHLAAHRTDEGTADASKARLFATEAATRAAMKAIQIYGGNGFVREFPVERFLRDAKTLGTIDGTVDRHRDVIAASLLAAVS
ncbi:MAG: acyl-CoA dehydrogenase family protein [Deltaproteobacteria bacterium]